MISSKSEFATELEFRTAHSKVHWSELSHDDSASSSAADSDRDHSHYFAELQKDAHWGSFCRQVVNMVVGKKLGEGAQADIYEATVTFVDGYERGWWGSTHEYVLEYVVKVMKADCALRDLQRQWPLGMARSAPGGFSTLIQGALVKDHATQNNRFGFVMKREWGDPRTLIDM